MNYNSTSQAEISFELINLKKYFPVYKGIMRRTTGYIRAVNGISFKIRRGETLGLVGESGSGKTTVGRAALRLIEPTDGQSIIEGKNIFTLSPQELRRMRPRMQLIFQDPYSSLDPRMPIGAAIGEAVLEHGIIPKRELRDYVLRIMQSCELRPYQYDRYPHEFSGGQRQRVCIARAFALNPNFVIADEPVSALDVSVQAQIINLMRDLQQERGLSYLFISHDLSVVKHISDTVAVMYLGGIVEMASKKELFSSPVHPYTRALLAAVPSSDPDNKSKRVTLSGDIVSSLDPPSGCTFHTRCKFALPKCMSEVPSYDEVAPGHFAACHRTGEI